MLWNLVAAAHCCAQCDRPCMAVPLLRNWPISALDAPCVSSTRLLQWQCGGSETQLHDAEVRRIPFVKSRLPWHCL